jgi:RNA polymerase sigma-70 factor (ECF subfamily)
VLGVNEFQSNSHEGYENGAAVASLVSVAGNDAPARNSTQARPDRTEADCDNVLVGRLKSGDQSAFEVIVARHRRRIFSMTYQMLRNREDAEEVTQDAFIHALRGLAGFRGDAAFSTWISRIALNLAHHRYWYWFRRKRHETVSFDAPLNGDSRATFGEMVAAKSDLPYEQFAADDLLNRVQEGMSNLSSMHREVLTLRTVHNLSYKDIAKFLGISIGTVKSRILRAREDLRVLSAIDAESGAR